MYVEVIYWRLILVEGPSTLYHNSWASDPGLYKQDSCMWASSFLKRAVPASTASVPLWLPSVTNDDPGPKGSRVPGSCFLPLHSPRRSRDPNYRSLMYLRTQFLGGFCMFWYLTWRHPDCINKIAFLGRQRTKVCGKRRAEIKPEACFYFNHEP